MTKNKRSSSGKPKKTAGLKAPIPKLFGKLLSFFRSHPYVAACCAIVIYLLAFQWPFVTSGDAWAESFAEYLDESVRLGWSEVLAQNWAGYLTIIPSFIAKLYVSLGGPLGHADYFFRGVVIAFTTLSAALVAAKFNRPLIGNDGLRIILAVCLVAILGDVASFSFINVWYIGFVPVILYCLNPARLSRKTDVSLGIYGSLIILTKPFIILLPLIIYRMIRTRQYLGSSILLAFTAFQSYLVLFKNKPQLVGNINSDVETVLGAVFTGGTTALYKLFHVVPYSWLHILVAALVLVLGFFALWRAKGFWIATCLAAALSFSIYSYILAPDVAQPYFGLKGFQQTAEFNLKTQREILINATLLVGLFLVLDYVLQRFKSFSLGKHRLRTAYFLLSLGLLLVPAVAKPINTSSAGVTNVPLDSFRMQLNAGSPSCVPLAPSAIFFEEARWHFSYRGTCKTLTHDLNQFKPDFQNMNTPIVAITFTYDAESFGLDEARLQAIVVPVINSDPHKSHSLKLTNAKAKRSYEAIAHNRTPGEIQLVTFNVTGLESQADYRFRLSSDPAVWGGLFARSNHLITYPYFLDN